MRHSGAPFWEGLPAEIRSIIGRIFLSFWLPGSVSKACVRILLGLQEEAGVPQCRWLAWRYLTSH